jgi:hypothetical protein
LKTSFRYDIYFDAEKYVAHEVSAITTRKYSAYGTSLGVMITLIAIVAVVVSLTSLIKVDEEHAQRRTTI